MNTRHPVSCALFDLDGLLLDTETIYTEVTQQIVGRFGKVFDWSIKSNMIGRPSRDSACYLVEALDLPIGPDTYLQERNALLREAFPTCRALPGAETLVTHLSSHGIPIAVATSSTRDLFELKTGHHRWFSLFDAVVTSDDPAVKRGKPAPDIFLRAAHLLRARPALTLVFEDAPSGLDAARAAGMRTVVVPDVNMDRSRYAGADLILDSLADFSPAEFGLPSL